VRFEGKQPYTPNGVSLFPLIFPDLMDQGWVKHGRIVFPCGALFDHRRREWQVSYGRNDTETCIDFIPHNKVIDKWLWREMKPGFTLSHAGGVA
jgi:predicted GH43/DUF377 family glycosyl hydrolase